MSKTPLSDLLRGQAAQPTPAPSSGNAAGWLLTLCLAAALALLVWNKFSGDSKPVPDDDRKEQVEPAPKVKGKTLIFIHERNPQPIEHDLLLREMPKFCGDRKLQWRAFDDDDTTEPIPAIIAFAKSKGVEPPFVAITNQADQPAKAIKWPAGVEGLEALLK